MNYEYMKNAQKIQEYVTNMRPAFNKRAVFSDETENYRTPFEPEPGDVVNVRIRTQKNNVDLVYLVYEDKKKVMDQMCIRDRSCLQPGDGSEVQGRRRHVKEAL